MAVNEANRGGSAKRGSAPAERGRNAARLLAQLVNRCDLLQMEATEMAATELAARIGQVGKLAMEAARQSGPLAESANISEGFRSSVTRILESLDTVQQLSAESGGVLRGEDLLSLQVAALELKALTAADDNALHDQGSEVEGPPGVGTDTRSRVMIVDDDESNREILARLLRAEPWELRLAASGMEALTLAQAEPFDLIMLDVLMPGMDGLTLLRRLRHDEQLREIPVIMISGVDQTSSVVACLEAGAADYVSKPFNPVLLRARINTALEHRRMALREKGQIEKLQIVLAELNEARATQERLIAAMLPVWASEELRSNGAVSPRYHSDVTVIFTDFAGFTASCSTLTAYELVAALNDYFTQFDDIVAKYGLERLKTVGDAYMCVAGLNAKTPSHPNDAVLAALEMLELASIRSSGTPSWGMRVGINTGPVVSGVVGNQRLAFDIWGDTVNLASRMVDAGSPGQINVSEKTFQRVKEMFSCETRGALPIKGGRLMEMFFVEGPATSGAGPSPEARERVFRERYGAYFGYAPPSLPGTLFNQEKAVGGGYAHTSR